MCHQDLEFSVSKFHLFHRSIGVELYSRDARTWLKDTYGIRHHMQDSSTLEERSSSNRSGKYSSGDVDVAFARRRSNLVDCVNLIHNRGWPKTNTYTRRSRGRVGISAYNDRVIIRLIRIDSLLVGYTVDLDWLAYRQGPHSPRATNGMEFPLGSDGKVALYGDLSFSQTSTHESYTRD